MATYTSNAVVHMTPDEVESAISAALDRLYEQRHREGIHDTAKTAYKLREPDGSAWMFVVEERKLET